MMNTRCYSIIVLCVSLLLTACNLQSAHTEDLITHILDTQVYQTQVIAQLPTPTNTVMPQPMLPTEEVIVVPTLMQPTATPTLQPTPTLPPPRGVGYYPVSDRVRRLYQRGLELGHHPDRFSKVGDSLTASQAFLLGYDTGEYQLGEFAYLQSTIDHFAGSFNRDSLAAFVGFNAAAMLDSIWGDPDLCLPNETPVACEYRVYKPSVALIMLGALDVQLYEVDRYRGYMEEIVQFTIDQGIIPVLTTFPNSGIYFQEKSVAFNQVLYDIAAQYEIPLIDLRPIAQTMPHGGVLEDGYHLTQRHEQHNLIDLNGEQHMYALTMRNYLTLEMLHSLMIGIPMD